MTIDVFTVNVLVALVVLVSGSVFILDTVLRLEVWAGKVWALSFLSGMLTVVCYLVWRAVPDPWLAIAAGNGALVATIGCLWLGCLRYNDRSILLSGLIVAGVSVAEVAITMAAGPHGGDWAGSASLFLCIGGFAALGAIESRRGLLGSRWTSLSFTVVLAVIAVYYGVRAGVFLSDGPTGQVFTTWFNSSITGSLSIVLTIVALVAATTLRSGQSSRNRELQEQPLHLVADGLLTQPALVVLLRSILARERDIAQPLAVVAFRVDDLPGIRTAFGTSVSEPVMAACRAGAQAYAPTAALAGEAGSDAIILAFPAGSVGEVRQIASRIQRRILDDISRSGSVVMPLIGVGVALSQTLACDADVLIDAALSAAKRSSISAEASVLVAE